MARRELGREVAKGSDMRADGRGDCHSKLDFGRACGVQQARVLISPFASTGGTQQVADPSTIKAA
ncbi:hypothetical protein ER13_11025 [Brevundimonas sp. EAKA]|nr:hypothetical protein ER13_11025 [Brevundimonas sp. EAKA]OGN41679.1 MAG: hypothetical protein A2795_01265 [Caulobacterales bacterium RIFCSPHIGHO2_01_FULL_67_30]OGN54762.1 MAG: hypothetical protein A3K57_04510 [Caulobacterales bacterium RIFOXYA1_FULL_67_7]